MLHDQVRIDFFCGNFGSREFFALVIFEFFFRFLLYCEKISSYFRMETTWLWAFACASKVCAIRFLIADRWLTAEIVKDAADKNIVAKIESFIFWVFRNYYRFLSVKNLIQIWTNGLLLYPLFRYKFVAAS